VVESIFNVFLLLWMRELALIISVKASPHPKDLLIRRKGRSLIPAIGARRRGEASVKRPIESILIHYTFSVMRLLQPARAMASTKIPIQRHAKMFCSSSSKSSFMFFMLC